MLSPRAPALLGVGYAATLLVVDGVLQSRDERTRQAWLAWCSTNLANLTDTQHGGVHPVAALVASAVVTEDGSLAWIGLALVGLWAAGRAVGTRRVVVLVGLVHVLATLVSEGILARRVAVGGASESAREMLDVGPSYVIVAALVVGIGCARGVERLLCGAGFVVVAPSLFFGLDQWEVAAVGHAVTILLTAGWALGWGLRSGRWPSADSNRRPLTRG